MDFCADPYSTEGNVRKVDIRSGPEAHDEDTQLVDRHTSCFLHILCPGRHFKTRYPQAYRRSHAAQTKVWQDSHSGRWHLRENQEWPHQGKLNSLVE